MPLFQCSHLTKNFGGLTAVNDLSFTVDEGEIVSIIGPNGAGKTTVFNLITGFYKPDKGQVILDGNNLVGLRPDEITRKGITRTFQNVRLFLNMSLEDNVMVGQHCRTSGELLAAIFRPPAYQKEQSKARRIVQQQLDFFRERLGTNHQQPASSLSYANRRRLEVARAMATEPKLLLLDEPTAGMNPQETAEMSANIKALREERGLTIFVIEHDMKVVGGISDRVVVMDYGQKIAEGSYEEVTSNPQVIEAYLGQGSTTHK